MDDENEFYDHIDDLDFEDYEEIQEIMDDEGLDFEDAVAVKESNGGGISCTAIIIIIILIALVHNYSTGKKIENNYGYEVETSGITAKPDCNSLEPQNPYSGGSGHFAGYEWGAEGNNCRGNSNSFIEGCVEYQNQENAYQYCLYRN